MAGDSAPRRLLLVEGRDDRHVVHHIRELQVPRIPPFEIVEKGGVDSLVRSISVEARVRGRTALGIMVDADTDPLARWASIAGQLHSAGVDLPPSMNPDGTIIPSVDGTGLGVTVGVWVMPDNNAQGEIEDFVTGLIPEKDPVWPLAEDYIRRIPVDHRPNDTTKARLHAWLAARPERPLPMGLAIRARELPLKGVADRFASWLRHLFHETEFRTGQNAA